MAYDPAKDPAAQARLQQAKANKKAAAATPLQERTVNNSAALSAANSAKVQKTKKRSRSDDCDSDDWKPGASKSKGKKKSSPHIFSP